MPTLAEFKTLVAHHEIGYYVVSSRGGSGAAGAAGDRAGSGGFGLGSQGNSTAIQNWVEQNFHATTVGEQTVYKLS